MSRKKRKAVKLDESMTMCMSILKQMQGKNEASPFLEPVDWEFYGLTDYPEIIKDPMDLGTIQERVENGKITTTVDFGEHVRLVWKNAMRYNRSDSDIYITAEKLSKVFEKKFAKVKPTGNVGGGMRPPVATDMMATKQRRKSGGAAGGAAGSKDRITFSKLIMGLPNPELNELVDRVAKGSPEALNEEEDEEIEIDINSINGQLLLELNTFMIKVHGKKRKL